MIDKHKFKYLKKSIWTGHIDITKALIFNKVSFS